MNLKHYSDRCDRAMERTYVKERLVYYFECMLDVKCNSAFESDNVDILSYKNISAAELVLVIKQVLNDVKPEYKNIKPFNGDVTLNNIIDFIMSAE